MLRDRLVCGINDPRIQRRLLAEPTLSYVKALELAHATETVKSNAKQLEQAMPCTAVQAISSEEKKVELVVTLLRSNRRQLKTGVTDAEGSITPISATSRTAPATTVKKRGILPKSAAANEDRSSKHKQNKIFNRRNKHTMCTQNERKSYTTDSFSTCYAKRHLRLCSRFRSTK